VKNKQKVVGQQTFYNPSNKDRLKNKYSKNYSAALENRDVHISINKYNSKCVPRE